MYHTTMMKVGVVSLLMAAIFLTGTLTTQAAKPAPGPPGGHLTIKNVLVDLNGRQLTITGEKFSFSNTLTVTLGMESLPLNIVTTSDTQIVVDLPPGPLVGNTSSLSRRATARVRMMSMI